MSVPSGGRLHRAALAAALLAWPPPAVAAQETSPPSGASNPSQRVLIADRLFDGVAMRTERAVGIADGRIVWMGAASAVPEGIPTLTLEGATLLPGLIEGHSHLLLHPYDETPWTDQVLRESLAERTARAVVHAQATLHAGVTTVRDLGTEGAGYADAGLRDAIDKGVIPGPRMIVTTRAIVATGSYNPRGAPEIAFHKGAEVADGHDDLIRVVRDQIGRGADWIKVYADYRWGPEGEARPTFTLAELSTIVEVAASSGRPVVAHASTAEGMRRATLAGVRTIEHGDGADREVLALMAERGVGLCATLAAGDAILRYGGWRPGVDPDPARIVAKRRSFVEALEAGVPICFGGDVGVYTHGDNVREAELMVDYGMRPLDVVRAATAGNAELFRLGDRGRIEVGRRADLLAVTGNPTAHIGVLRRVRLVMKGGEIVRHEER